jgi:RimJ/RimL family protein N-acetyltransferase/ADP-ribose pyrophosphatase YjhB (NUDIX family)
VPPQPTLRESDVTLRPWRAADVEEARLQHDEQIARWFGFSSIIPTAGQQAAAIERWTAAYRDGRETVGFVVEHAGRLAGTVEVRQKGDAVGELSWAVFPEHRRERVATRAVRMLIDYCFADLGLVRVEARVEPENLPSLRTASRAGLRREGLLRQAQTTGGIRRDDVLLSRLADDPAPQDREGFIGVLNAGLPLKRVIAQGVIRNLDGGILLCELTYKREWDLPGGVVDRFESPAQGLLREVHEELGLDLAVRSLLLVNWLPPWRGWDDACQFVFDLGAHEETLVDRMLLEGREIAAVRWCTAAEAAAHVAPYLADLLERLIGEPGEPAYLEAGIEKARVSRREESDGSAGRK